MKGRHKWTRKRRGLFKLFSMLAEMQSSYVCCSCVCYLIRQLTWAYKGLQAAHVKGVPPNGAQGIIMFMSLGLQYV